MALHDLDRHFEVNETRLEERQRELVHCIDPQAVVSGVGALMKFQTRPAGRSNLGPDVDTPEQAVRFGTGTIHKLPAVLPVAFTHRLVVFPGPNEVVRPYRLRVLLSLMRPCRHGASSASAKVLRIALRMLLKPCTATTAPRPGTCFRLGEWTIDPPVSGRQIWAARML